MLFLGSGGLTPPILKRFLSVRSVNGAEGISNIEGKVARVSDERVGRRSSLKSVVGTPVPPKIRVDSWLLLLRDCLKRRNRFVDDYPWQFIFEKYCFLRRKRGRIVERRNREINCVRVFTVFEKQMSAATRGK